MPKIVDHEQRRQELIETTWRIIARHGLSGVTMRQIATEAGFANGALKPYFPAKSDLLVATYHYVYERTKERITDATHGLRGLEALEAFAMEVLPVNETLQDEARIVLSFWDAAAQNPERAKVALDAIDQWRADITTMLEEATEDGELRVGVDTDSIVGILIGFLHGSQIDAALDPRIFSPERLQGDFAGYLALLRS